jgi:hypothetical protein
VVGRAAAGFRPDRWIAACRLKGARMTVREVWKPLFDRSVTAFYEGDFAEGRLACDRLLGLPELPEEVSVVARRNAVHYARPLAELVPDWSPRRLHVPLEPGWAALNPAIVPDREDGSAGTDGPVRVLVRTANFRLDPPASYVVTDGGGAVRTAYHLLALRDDLAPADDGRRLLDLTPDDGWIDHLVQGNEDLRPIRCGDRSLATGQTWRRDAAGGRAVRTALFDLDLEHDRAAPTLANLRWLSRGDEGIAEKNWMPLVAGGELLFVYSCAPTVVLACRPETGALAIRGVHDAPLLARGFRGGSPLLPDAHGFLALVHEVAFWEDGARAYLHRLVRFEPDLRLAAASHPFRFHGENVEFALGLARRGGDLLVSYGIGDCEAWVAAVPETSLTALLRPIVHLAPAGSVAMPIPAGALLVANERRPRLTLAASRAVAAGFTPAGAPAVAHPSAAGVSPAAPPRPECFGVPPFLVSMTLSGNARDTVGDALRSVVDWVDACLLIDTGITDDTLSVAGAVAGDKLVVRSFPWRDDFAAARNAALAFAAELGAVWGVFVDTDERIEARGVDIRGFLASSAADAVFLSAADGAYRKERFFRLPSTGSYVGPTHECWIGPSRSALTGAAFRELGKDDDALRRKLERDLAILHRHTEAHPDDPRWWYYLGDTLANLRRLEEAIAAFERCVDLDGWDEEAGWAAYRIARLLGDDLGRWQDAEAACAHGLTRHPTMVELYWAAGYAAYWGGRPQRAAHWARAAIAINEAAAAGRLPERGGFTYVPAHWEGPWDVLRHALRVLGDEDGAAAAERGHAAAFAARTAAEADAALVSF